MNIGSTSTVVTGGVALLERSMAYTLGSLVLVTPDAMTRHTPCAGWDLRALLLHMNASLLTLHEAAAVGRLELGTSDVGDPHVDYGDPGLDPVGTLRNRACRMVGTWANLLDPRDIAIADRALSPGVIAATGALEVAVHGWDVSRTTGHDRPVPPALAEELLELGRLLVSDRDRPHRFAAPVELVDPWPASSSDRLVAFLGRSPH